MNKHKNIQQIIGALALGSLICLSLMISSCGSEPSISFAIGDLGPAGGIVVFNKGEEAIGWQYIEASLVDTTGGQWGCSNQSISSARQEAIGFGLLNSESIVTFHNNLDNFYTNPSICSDMNNGTVAAKACLDYNAGEFSDWHLPSSEEMDLLHSVLHLNGFGDFNTNELYWTSTEDTDSTAMVFSFDTGELMSVCKACPMENQPRVRAIRYF